jgi:hypothetical protein
MPLYLGSFVQSFNPNFSLAGARLTRTAASVNVWLMGLLRGLFWFALFIFFTFCFVVLFEYGTSDFSNGFKKEFARVKSFVTSQTEKGTAEKKEK